MIIQSLRGSILNLIELIISYIKYWNIVIQLIFLRIINNNEKKSNNR